MKAGLCVSTINNAVQLHPEIRGISAHSDYAEFRIVVTEEVSIQAKNIDRKLLNPDLCRA